MKKVKIDPATQRRPSSRKQQRNAKIRESLNQQVEVQVIPALEDMEGYEKRKPRVCAYCRVSTDMDTQALSYELQVQNYTEYINSNPDWEFAGIYADRGISGTSLKHRDDFNRMVADCRAGKIDLIVTKAVTRFARNVLDCISTVRMLKQLDPPVGVYFETERINTLDTTSETYLGLISLFAQGESESKSESLKWSYIRRWKRGTGIYPTWNLLGYEVDEEGHWVIVENEAELIRIIFDMYLNGHSSPQIAEILTRSGIPTATNKEIPTKTGKKKWHTSVIRSILSNEKYTGNAILGKTFKPDVLSKKRQKNTGQAPMYYAEGTHPAIIDQETFELVKAELERRKEEKTEAVGSSRYSSKYPFSGLLICGECGHKLRRHVRRVGSGKMVPAWGCSHRISNGRAACDSHHVNEETLQRTYTAAVQEMIADAEEVVQLVRDSAGLVMEPGNKVELAQVEQEIIELQAAVMALHKAKQKRGISAAEYAEKIREHSQRMEELEARQEELQTTENRYNQTKVWLENFARHIQTGEIMNTDDSQIMKQLVEQIIVGADSMEIQFKCGVIAKHEYVK